MKLPEGRVLVKGQRATRSRDVDFARGAALLLRLLLPHRVVKTVRPARLYQLLGADHAEFTIGDVA